MGAVTKTRRAAVAVDEDAQYLTFMLGGEMFAIGILGIKEIIEYGSLTVVPMMPAFVRGVIQPARCGGAGGRPVGALWPRQLGDHPALLRGHHRSEHRRWPAPGHRAAGRHGVCGAGDRRRADRTAAQLRRAVRADFISGMAKVDGKFVIVLAVDKVLSIDEMSSLAEAVGMSLDVDPR